VNAACLADELHLQPPSIPPSALLAFQLTNIALLVFWFSSSGVFQIMERFLAVMVFFEEANGRFVGVDFPRGDCLDMRENACCSLRG